MVLKENTICQTFLLSQDIRTMIPDDLLFFFIEKIVNYIYFSEIYYQWGDTHCKNVYSNWMLVRIIIMGTICSIHCSRKFERVFVKILFLCI